jgi:polar amino acid transport system substrate-binding protein
MPPSYFQIVSIYFSSKDNLFVYAPLVLFWWQMMVIGIMANILRTLLFWSVFMSATQASTPPLIIAETDGVQLHQFAAQVLKIAYERANIPMTLKVIPGKRALILAQAGEVDGDVGRIKTIPEQYPNLVVVPTPLVHFTAYAYGIDPTIQVNSWSDLRNYRVGSKRGSQYSEVGTQGMNRELFNDFDKMLEMLVNGRIDVAIAAQTEIKPLLTTRYSGKNIHVLGSPVFEAPLYHVLHKSHQALIPELNTVLTQMQSTGELDALFQAFLLGLPNNP